MSIGLTNHCMDLALFLHENGFTRGTIDKTLLCRIHGKDLFLIQIYVDDIIFGSTNDKFCQIFAELMQFNYQMSMMRELRYFSGIPVKQVEDRTFINQDKYTRNLLKKFNMQECVTATTPMATSTELDSNVGEKVGDH